MPSSHSLDQPIKFPKIPHLHNLGSATRDDNILSPSDLTKWISENLYLVVEEKIDGANIGIWIHSDNIEETITESGETQKIYHNSQIMVQNRSHFINCHYHKQFEKIQYYLDQHIAELYDLLTPNEMILYGEWCYAKHSIAYDSLPAYFVAYDIYHIPSRQFLHRSVVERLLSAKTTIPIIHKYYDGPLRDAGISSIEDILTRFVYGSSHYSTTDQREGIVLRFYQNAYHLNEVDQTTATAAAATAVRKVCKKQGVHHHGDLEMKCKIVRENFIAGSDRWNKSGKLPLNTLSKDLFL
jgi:hypothetical protein